MDWNMTQRTDRRISFCPACRTAVSDCFLEIRSVPVNCSALWADRNSAIESRKAAIELVFCRMCALIFNSIFDPKLMNYDVSYDNSLDFSKSFQDYSHGLVTRLIGTYDLRRKRILEIGSGKGHFLRLLCEMGANEGIGFDPTYEAHSGPVGEGMVTFVRDIYRGEGTNHANCVCFRHVLEHIDNPASFLQELRRGLGGGSKPVVYCEVPNASFIFSEPSIWDIIYQHASYFTAPALKYLFESNGFRTLDIGTSYGGQFLYIEAVPSGSPISAQPVESDRVGELVATFRRSYTNTVASWQELLDAACLEGRRLALWGCGAKGATFLNVVPGAERIQVVTDINPHKHGMYVPGTGQRILSPNELKTTRPDTIVLPNPVYKTEVERSLADLGLVAEVVEPMTSHPALIA
jgi:SAM-dependent methyltransferase